MANYAHGVNPTILRWARERSGHSLASAAQSLRKAPELLQLWESGQGVPTYNQLEKLAYSIYKRPMALFFFSEPPEEPDPHESFRTLPDFEIDALLPDTRHAIRQAQGFQLSLAELTEGINPSPRRIFLDVALSPQDNIQAAAESVRSYLGVPLSQQLAWPSTEAALAAWRDAVQEAGVFVFKRAFKQEDVSGFCLVGDQFPIVFLNNATAKTRQIFSLFHELAHILLKTSSVTKLSDTYIQGLSGYAREVEVFCNRFTAAFLVPSDDFDRRLSQAGDLSEQELSEQIPTLAKLYRVSREVILRKLLDRSLIDSDYYESSVRQWLAEFKRPEEARRSRPDYYTVQASYLGEKYLGLVFTKYYQGLLSTEQLADHLNINVKSVAGLEQAFLRKASSE